MNHAPYPPVQGDLYRTLFALLQHSSDTTRQHLADMTGLAPTSLNRALDRLMRHGWIMESGLADSTGGRRPNLYRLATDKTYLASVLLYEEQPALVLLDLNFSVLDVRTLSNLPAPNDPDIQTWPQHFWQTWQALLTERGLSEQQLPGIALVHNPSLQDDADSQAILMNLIEKLPETAEKSIVRIEKQDSLLYAAVWQPGGPPDRSVVACLADYDTVHIGLAVHGKKHAGRLKFINAEKMLTGFSAGGKPVALARLALRNGLLRQFCRSKNDKQLTWDDFVKAACENKKKASEVIDASADAFATIISNLLLAANSAYWSLEGQIFDDLPDLASCIKEHLSAFCAKAGLEPANASADGQDRNIRIASGAAALLTEELLLKLE